VLAFAARVGPGANLPLVLSTSLPLVLVSAGIDVIVDVQLVVLSLSLVLPSAGIDVIVDVQLVVPF